MKYFKIEFTFDDDFLRESIKTNDCLGGETHRYNALTDYFDRIKHLEKEYEIKNAKKIVEDALIKAIKSYEENKYNNAVCKPFRSIPESFLTKNVYEAALQTLKNVFLTHAKEIGYKTLKPDNYSVQAYHLTKQILQEKHRIYNLLNNREKIALLIQEQNKQKAELNQTITELINN